ncbi:uncharacterized protein LOC131683276 [Topomyia yanbarensis]|uniref:uncharacterized protein LOC131683276 n=1 Tax=Topomyia yanbarensis TaxID=2498891 RepID=UPI00273CBF4B|nr:uncharacterized protein LOC131683276 [Topomyia yanbarensis]
MLLELKKNTTTSSSALQETITKSMGGKAEVKALSPEMVIVCKDLDEITTEDELRGAMKQQCKLGDVHMTIRLRKGYGGTQTVMIRLPVTAADKALEVYAVAAKPFLGNFLLQTVSSFSSSADPKSYVSDFRTQQNAVDRTVIHEMHPSDYSKNSETAINKMGTSSIVGTQHRDGELHPELNTKKINKIFGLARERLTGAFHRLFNVDSSTVMKNTSNPFIVGSNTFVKHDELDGNEAILSDSLNSKAVVNDRVKYSSNMGPGYDLRVDISNSVYKNKDQSNETTESISDLMKVTLPVEEQIDPDELTKFGGDFNSDLNNSTVTCPQQKKGFIIKRLENIIKRLNNTRHQFRTRTVHAVVKLIPLVHSVVNKEIYKKKPAGRFLENGRKPKTKDGNEYSMPFRLSKLSHNLLAFNEKSKEQASLVFQNAFNRYAQLITSGMNTATDVNNSISKEAQQKERIDNYSTVDTGRNNVVKNDDDSYENNARSDRMATDKKAIDVNVSNSANYVAASKRMNLQKIEMVGILILEVFGSIAGLTWGAFNQLQLFFK